MSKTYLEMLLEKFPEIPKTTNGITPQRLCPSYIFPKANTKCIEVIRNGIRQGDCITCWNQEYKEKPKMNYSEMFNEILYHISDTLDEIQLAIEDKEYDVALNLTEKLNDNLF